jgi:hypothetical protein
LGTAPDIACCLQVWANAAIKAGIGNSDKGVIPLMLVQKCENPAVSLIPKYVDSRDFPEFDMVSSTSPPKKRVS